MRYPVRPGLSEKGARLETVDFAGEGVDESSVAPAAIRCHDAIFKSAGCHVDLITRAVSVPDARSSVPPLSFWKRTDTVFVALTHAVSVTP
jgi:hypothetical protein